MDRILEEVSRQQAQNRAPKKWLALVAIVLPITLITVFASWAKYSAKSDWLLVTRGSIEANAAGVGQLVSSNQQVLVSAEPGFVEVITAGVGDELGEGAALMRIRNPQLVAELESAKIDARRDSLEREASLLRATQDLERAELELLQAEAAEVVARSELSMNKELADRGIMSRIALQQAEARALQTQAGREAARRLSLLAQDQKQKQEDLAREAEAGWKLRLQRLEQRVSSLSISFPARGVVKRLAARVGDAIAAGQVVAEIGPPRPDRAIVRFPQRFSSALAPGLEASVFVLDQRTKGKIVRVSADLAGGQVETEIKVDDMPASARIDMAVRAEVTLSRQVDVLFVEPLDEPSVIDGQVSVEVLSSGDYFSKRSVRLSGVSISDGRMIIGGGVSAGDRIRFLEEQQSSP